GRGINSFKMFWSASIEPPLAQWAKGGGAVQPPKEPRDEWTQRLVALADPLLHRGAPHPERLRRRRPRGGARGGPDRALHRGSRQAARAGRDDLALGDRGRLGHHPPAGRWRGSAAP